MIVTGWPHPAWPRSFRTLFALFAAVILAVAFFSYRAQAAHLREGQIAQLRAIAQLKADNVARWLEQHRRINAIASRDPIIGAALARWRHSREPALRDRLLESMRRLGEAYAYDRVDLFDTEGRALLRSGTSAGESPATKDAMRRAVESGDTVLIEPRPRDNTTRPGLGFASPMRATDGSVLGVLLAELSAMDYLYPLVRGWPLPNTSGETLLARRDGDMLRHLVDTRLNPDAAAPLRGPLRDAALLALAERRAATGLGPDYRDRPVIAVAMPVPDSSWLLIAKIDESEANIAIERLLLTTGLTTLLALALAAGTAGLIRRRDRLLLRHTQLRFAASLDESNRDLALAQAIGHIGSWRYDIERDALEWSCETYRIFGVAREDTPTLNKFFALVHPEDREYVEAAWRDALAGAFHYDIHHRIVVEGAVKWVREQAEIEFDATGKPRLAHGVAQDVTTERLAIEGLERSQTALRTLNENRERIREEERTRIAREVHDELGQILSALKMDLGWLKSHLRPEQGALIDQIGLMSAKIDATVATVRRIAHELRPPLLDTLGLGAALEVMVDDFRKRMGIRCHADVPADALPLPPEHAIALYRIAQELLTNVARHAYATRVNIALRRGDAHVELVIEDNGRGLRISAGRDLSLGLTGIRERVAQMNGAFEIGNAPNLEGTRAIVRLPIQSNCGSPP